MCMKCKLCHKTTQTSVSKKRHCWSTNQLCPKCHYLGEPLKHVVLPIEKSDAKRYDVDDEPWFERTTLL